MLGLLRRREERCRNQRQTERNTYIRRRLPCPKRPLEIRSLDTQPQQTRRDSQRIELRRVALHLEDEGVHGVGGREGDDQRGGDEVDEEAADGRVEGFRGGEDVGVGEEALSGDFML
jgi:hypothetical protein